MGRRLVCDGSFCDVERGGECRKAKRTYQGGDCGCHCVRFSQSIDDNCAGGVDSIGLGKASPTARCRVVGAGASKQTTPDAEKEPSFATRADRVSSPPSPSDRSWQRTKGPDVCSARFARPSPRRPRLHRNCIATASRLAPAATLLSRLCVPASAARCLPHSFRRPHHVTDTARPQIALRHALRATLDSPHARPQQTPVRPCMERGARPAVPSRRTRDNTPAFQAFIPRFPHPRSPANSRAIAIDYCPLPTALRSMTASARPL
ncbi:hypothetical protein P154DRAFT_575104 [Amniculicola lignicola CBS 123094]|uniref:Uncharacterized protein n=1 Tax=Amniculicola lignicola CBS 123094 TaxID=1392246 RepID=A0A6A5WHS1_9PLEO|nr:hypothetical protein P154DRAFT_575104 [Amniculicola lignicola CBS 123094]